MSELIKQFFVKPRMIGAMCPSTRFLAKEITSHIGLEKCRSVVEVGPGTGAFTKHIVKKIAPGTRFIAVELNEKVFQVLKKRFPQVRMHNKCASDLDKILYEENISGGVELIISGLPWAAFTSEQQEDVLSAIYASLKPNGIFTTFAYLQGMILPSAQRFKKRLEYYFSSVQKGRIVWHNIPPAFVYRCKK